MQLCKHSDECMARTEVYWYTWRKHRTGLILLNTNNMANVVEHGKQVMVNMAEPRAYADLQDLACQSLDVNEHHQFTQSDCS